MPQEMSFAQALTEARQIIVQQSNRIKADLDRVKALQETINGHTAALAESDRQLKAKTSEVDLAHEQVKLATGRYEELKAAKEQGDAVIDRQGQRLTQMQDTIKGLEEQLAELTQKADHFQRELDSMRGQVPTQEDTEALAALASLLSAKKGASAAPAAKPADSGHVHQDTANAA